MLIHYNIWHEARHIPRSFDVLHYEDMADAPHDALRKVLAFLDVGDVDDTIVGHPVQFGGFDNMLSMSKEEKYNTFILGAGSPEDPESYKVRKGLVGAFAEYLSPGDIAYIDQCVREIGNPFERHVTA